MKAKSNTKLIIGLSLIVLFIIYTILVKLVDVKDTGLENSVVGFSTINFAVRDLVKVNFTLYDITDWAGVFAVLVGVCFAVVGVVQLINRKNIKKVDGEILLLGAFYVVTFIVYLAFEFIKINFRPVLIEGVLETSYPSSTTMLALCFIPTAIFEINRLIKNKTLKVSLSIILWAITALMVIGRILSGVHWITDIIGGIIISGGLVITYLALRDKISKKK